MDGSVVSIKRPRESGVEAFRLVLMFLIVLRHCLLLPGMDTSWTAVMLFALTGPSVDGFVMISGWYGIRPTLKKYVRLLALMLFYGALAYGVNVWRFGWGGTPDYEVSGAWFGRSYLALMLVAPLINAGVEVLAGTPRRLLGAWGCYALAITLSAIPFRLGALDAFDATGWGSHTFNTLLFTYVTARVAKTLGVPERLGRRTQAAFWGVFVLSMLGVIGCVAVMARMAGMEPGSWSARMLLGYDMPHVWLWALLMLFIFLRVRLPGWVGAAVRFMAPSVFGIFLVHTAMGEVFLQWPMDWLKARCPGMPQAIAVLSVTAGCFLASLAVDLLRRIALGLLRLLWRMARGV